MDTTRFHFELTPEGDTFTVVLRVGDSEPVEDRFDFEYRDNSRISQVVSDVREGNCDIDDLRDIGSLLWQGLLAANIRTQLEAELVKGQNQGSLFQVRLTLPPELDNLPWEALYDEEIGFLASDSRYCIVRDPPDFRFKPELEPKPSPLNILVVIPQGSGLQVEHEWQNLKHAVGKLGQAIKLGRMDGQVTPDKLREKLDSGQWDIVHYVGHGAVNEAGRVHIRINQEHDPNEDFWMPGEAFSAIFRRSGVRLAVLNCCLGGYSSSSRSLSGLGPFLIRAGVTAVVAMQYEVADDVAVKFSDAFYKGFFGGDELGRVDLALEKARETVYLNQTASTVRGFITPVLYVPQGGEHLFKVEPLGAAERSPRPKSKRGVQLPDDLVEAVQEGLCIPVVGPGVLRAGSVRSKTRPPGFVDLAKILDSEEKYPREADFELCVQAGEWMAALLFQWVCQHYLTVRKRFRLVRLLKEAYLSAQATPPPSTVMSIAAWNIKGLIYENIDGLMEQAFERLGKPARVLNDVRTTTPESSVNNPLLVNLRGTLEDFDSLVLTEEDNDLLWEGLGHLSPQVSSLVLDEPGRSLFFLGVSPRDPIVRRLASKLLDTSTSSKQGRSFFACQAIDRVSEACWGKYDIEWVEGDLNDVIESIS